MFLTRINRLRGDDRGSAMIAVLALAGVTAVIAVTVGSVSVSSLKFSNDVSAGVEARAAAEAGITTAELALRTRTGCSAAGGVFTSTNTPKFRVTVSYDRGSGWVEGCPVREATHVRVQSTGYATRATFSDSRESGGRVVEAVYQYIPQYVEIPFLDPAVYAYTVDGILRRFVLDTADITISADLQIKTGHFVCTNNAQVNGDVILADGYADLTACTITGRVHATDYVRMSNGSVIREDLLTVGDGVVGSNPVVTVSGGSQVRGSVFAGGSVSVLSGPGSRVIGNVTAHRDTATTVSVAAGSTVDGNVLSSGTIQPGGSILGTRSAAVVGLSAPPPPQVPDWTDIPWAVSTTAQFEATSWFQQGFTNRVVWSGSCDFGNHDPRWVALQTYTTPTVIDATGCVGGVVTLNNLKPDIGLQTDIVFFSNSFRFDKLYFASANPTANRKLYFIVPDNTPNSLPTCSGGAGDIYLTNEADFRSTVSAFIYSPCRVRSDRNGFRGQLYGGTIDFDQQAQMTYVPTSPPGIDLSASLPPNLVLNDAFLGERLSIREVSSGG
ncbi:hypothetical protein GCM10009792_04490 [Microcella alkalica]|uniref:Uncharacterized protein n=1 Tax=Microcella alkalica TaxID=355930 RepID=A0A839E8B7_9MICO|nr:polymer-forming cytoskeletal protein [Microcella alkalica]MBA8848771.1 hypothetical protein [Microcella alkalica]